MTKTTSLPRLPATCDLLVAGGDARILLDPATGRSPYGCRSRPEPELVALGSCTATPVTAPGYALASALRERCLAQLRYATPEAVYADQAARLRSELLACCGITPTDGVQAVLAASGTDLFLLATQWLQPALTVMIAPAETGSGVPAAVRGRHFNARSPCAGEVPLGAPIGAWQGELAGVAVREADGALRDPASIDADCEAEVARAAGSGRRVLLIVTDVSKTGLIAPSIDLALRLKQRYRDRLEVMVDACQFRLSAASLRAYLALDWIVALTGSKFVGGPTFCGALLMPPAGAARYREVSFDPGAGAYSSAADWAPECAIRQSLPSVANFGLLLRWAVALGELRALCALPEAELAARVRDFGLAMRTRLQKDPRFLALPVAPLRRAGLGVGAQWDGEQTIFPFLLRAPGGALLAHADTAALYRSLRSGDAATGRRAYLLGQPVSCGEREGEAYSALRICAGAGMLTGSREDAGRAIAQAQAALDALAELLARRRAVGQIRPAGLPAAA